MSDYHEFLANKTYRPPSSGLDVAPDEIHPSLFGFQRQSVQWAVRRGRSALFADTGLGKTRMQVEWARIISESESARVLILAPLAVSAQTVAEASLMDVTVTYCRDSSQIADPGIYITNYERLHKFDPAAFVGVVLDESSILKSFSGTTKKAIIAAFARTPYRLACTATPAPNDLEELTNHADFLGVMSANEMRSTFFIADSRGEFMKYRIKGHARKSFYKWMTTWALAIRKPSDLGWPDEGFDLPPLTVESHFVGTAWAPDGQLFAHTLEGVTERASVRRSTITERVARAVELVKAEPGEPWLVWCGQNAEADAIMSALMPALGPRIVEVRGSDDPEEKASALLSFASGRSGVDVLVTKPSIAGFGMNFQRCSRMVFVGLSDSYETYYQSIRRCYRFGQTKPVTAHIVLSEPERPIYANVLNKERQARELMGGILAGAVEAQRESLKGTSAGDDYSPRIPITIPEWLTEEAA